MGCSPPGSSAHEILQARILEWVAIPFFSGSSWPRDRTRVSCIAGRFFTAWATREAPITNTDRISVWTFSKPKNCWLSETVQPTPNSGRPHAYVSPDPGLHVFSLEKCQHWPLILKEKAWECPFMPSASLILNYLICQTQCHEHKGRHYFQPLKVHILVEETGINLSVTGILGACERGRGGCNREPGLVSGQGRLPWEGGWVWVLRT